MANVFLDGESVDFQGPAPGSASEVWSLLENFMGQSGLLIQRMLVDGKEWTPDVGDGSGEFQSIEVFSMTQEQNVSNMIGELLGQREGLLERWRASARAALSRPWESFREEAIEVLNATQPLVQCVGLLVEYSKNRDADWTSALEEVAELLNQALSSVMDAFEASNCIAFSDTAERALPIRLEKVYSALSKQVLPNLDSAAEK